VVRLMDVDAAERCRVSAWIWLFSAQLLLKHAANVMFRNIH
jgi:hypothetical protein